MDVFVLFISYVDIGFTMLPCDPSNKKNTGAQFLSLVKILRLVRITRSLRLLRVCFRNIKIHEICKANQEKITITVKFLRALKNWQHLRF